MSLLVHFIFSLQTNLKLYHWTTNTYSRHKAIDELLETFLEDSDRFMEVYIGKYGRKPFTTKKNSTLTIHALNDVTAEKFLRKSIRFLTVDVQTLLSESDFDLLTIRDDMVAALNKTRYLFTLR